MLARVHACAVVGLEGHIVDVEVDFNPKVGIPSFVLVGLPDAAVKESRERVRSAIKNSNRATQQRLLGDYIPHLEDVPTASLQFPNKGYTVNLSPAYSMKHGPIYDLAIAVGVLAVTDQVPLKSLQQAVFLAELSLDGTLRHVQGILPMIHAAQQAGFKTAYVSEMDAQQAALIDGIDVIPIHSLGQLVEHLYGLSVVAPYISVIADEPEPNADEFDQQVTDFADIRGQEHVKRALEIAAGGNHNVRLSGPPGTGKTLLARAMPGILPRLSKEEALEVTRIYSVADLLPANHPLMQQRPFRAPHHTISSAGMIGGGSIPRPGETTLSHRGVLFLDEANELASNVLEVLRQPIEDKVVTISRARGTLTFPANFMLILAQNPCPCGYFGDPVKSCTCTPAMITRYQSKLSGPLLDRIDIHIDVPRVEYEKLAQTTQAESSIMVRQRVETARARQTERFEKHRGLYANSDMGVSEINKYCVLSAEAKQLLEISSKRMELSARAYHRVQKLARTIADLADSDRIEVHHIAEAIQYRPRQTM